MNNEQVVQGLSQILGNEKVLSDDLSQDGGKKLLVINQNTFLSAS